ncbi:thiamine pyrophosphokinase [Mucilaginibacter aquatilis]|uniref:Thiamine pyrophosphokinase n=1 Tax=Mucilaginibacter aquatilis TaxID=1517760 RepID=A0A6I4I6J6_9SPHI|nr:thiamine pyrophosphokinase [Mucilaginibacter aquatilis]MVN90702.1 thiamine pyrophosphokinase [Mucilaginibacter aquatilis]
MSSHHIVREKQEPALLVLGLNNFNDDELGQLLEWSPTVIADADIAEQLIAYGIKVDYVVANNDFSLQANTRLITMGNDNVVEAALNFLVQNAYPAVNIVTDDFDAEQYLKFASQINIVIFHNRKKIYTITSGFTKWKPAGEEISLLTDSEVQLTGLTKVNGSTYLTAADGFFNLKFAEEFVFISENMY